MKLSSGMGGQAARCLEQKPVRDPESEPPQGFHDMDGDEFIVWEDRFIKKIDFFYKCLFLTFFTFYHEW